MELVLTRSYYEGGTNGTIRCEGEELCHTIELPWKNNRPCFSCIPAIVTTIAGYLAVAGTVATAVSQVTVEGK